MNVDGQPPGRLHALMAAPPALVPSTEEVFDLYDRRGRPLGRSKPRALVHRDGDWHRSFHCWIVSPGREAPPGILLQRRAPQKETWGGLWDVSVAGHYAAGEGIEGGLREIAEEVGLHVQADELLRVARRREDLEFPGGLIEREIQDVYFLVREIELADLRSDPSEVTGLALVPLPSFEDLVLGRAPRVSVPAVEIGQSHSLHGYTLDLTSDALVPRSGNYYHRVARFARGRLAGSERRDRLRRW